MPIGPRDEQLDTLESKLAEILAQLDKKVSTVVSDLQGTGSKTLSDIESAVKGLQSASETLQSVIDAISGLKGASDKDLTTLEEDIESILAKLDKSLSTVVSDLRGGSSKTLSDLETDLDALNDKLGARSSILYGQVTVGTSRVALPSNSVPAGYAVVVKADPDNSGIVYVGDSSVDTTSGFILAAGDSVTLRVTNTTLINVIASASGQKVCWIVEG